MKNTVKYTRYRGENEAGSRARARQNDRCAEITRYKQESCSSEQRIEQRRHAWRPPRKRENLPSSRTKRDKGEIYVYASRGKYEITRQAPRGACAYIICTYAKILSRSACAYVIAKRRKEREIIVCFGIFARAFLWWKFLRNRARGFCVFQDARVWGLVRWGIMRCRRVLAQRTAFPRRRWRKSCARVLAY